VLPFVVAVIFVLVNRKQEMGIHKAGTLPNAGLVAAFIFACFIAYTGIMVLSQFF
jgi:Mn2+/Fe2+ NRAMP family transporter